MLKCRECGTIFIDVIKETITDEKQEVECSCEDCGDSFRFVNKYGEEPFYEDL